MRRRSSQPDADGLPIADELLPFLKNAVETAPGELVFPNIDSSMLSQHTPLEDVLRRAMKNAGLVTGYRHVCRVKGCGHADEAGDDTLRRCPAHGHKLWVKALVRPIRFHSLRHTTAGLLLMSGAGIAAVQRVLRHSNPQITMSVYGHLAPEFLRTEVNRLQFGLTTESERFAATVLPLCCQPL